MFVLVFVGRKKNPLLLLKNLNSANTKPLKFIKQYVCDYTGHFRIYNPVFNLWFQSYATELTNANAILFLYPCSNFRFPRLPTVLGIWHNIHDHNTKVKFSNFGNILSMCVFVCYWYYLHVLFYLFIMQTNIQLSVIYGIVKYIKA